MRVYKFQDHYIDLDHVLMVSDLVWWKKGDETIDAAWFYVTLAFREKRKRFGFGYNKDIEDQEDIIRYQHKEFLKAWQNI